MTDNSEQRRHEITILRNLYPGAAKKRIAKLWRMAQERGIQLLQCRTALLDNLMCAIIRHEETVYDQALRAGLSKENGRNLIDPIIKKRMCEMKGEVS